MSICVLKALPTAFRKKIKNALYARFFTFFLHGGIDFFLTALPPRNIICAKSERLTNIDNSGKAFAAKKKCRADGKMSEKRGDDPKYIKEVLTMGKIWKAFKDYVAQYGLVFKLW